LSLVDEIKDKIRDVKDFPKKGISFKDITPILKNPKLSSKIVKELSGFVSKKSTHIVGIESRGL
jgi:adenine phosphoribosyltransferase